MAGKTYHHTVVFTHKGEDRFQLQFNVRGVETTTKCQVLKHKEVANRNTERHVPYVEPVYLIDVRASRNMNLHSPLAIALIGMIRDATEFIGKSVCSECENHFEMIFPDEIPLDKKYNMHVSRALRGIQEIAYA